MGKHCFTNSPSHQLIVTMVKIVCAAALIGALNADDCIDYMNQYRAQAGLAPLSGGGGDCEADDAAYDCINGWHQSFGKCGEGGQCEAECTSCQQAVDMFYNEGP